MNIGNLRKSKMSDRNIGLEILDGVRQSAFAGLMGVSVRTVQD